MPPLFWFCYLSLHRHTSAWQYSDLPAHCCPLGPCSTVIPREKSEKFRVSHGSFPRVRVDPHANQWFKLLIWWRKTKTGFSSSEPEKSLGWVFQVFLGKKAFFAEPCLPRHAKSVLYLIRCGHAAPSADNSQPWHFFWDGSKVLLDYDTQRALGTTFGPHDPATLLTMGGVLENMLQGASENRWPVSVTLFPRSKNVRYAAIEPLDVAAEPARTESSLFQRHTNRFPYRKEGIESRIMRELHDLGEGGAHLKIFEEKEQINDLSRLVESASQIRFQTREVHEWLGKSLRFSPEEIRNHPRLETDAVIELVWRLPPAGQDRFPTRRQSTCRDRCDCRKRKNGRIERRPLAGSYLELFEPTGCGRTSLFRDPGSAVPPGRRQSTTLPEGTGLGVGRRESYLFSAETRGGVVHAHAYRHADPNSLKILASPPRQGIHRPVRKRLASISHQIPRIFEQCGETRGRQVSLPAQPLLCDGQTDLLQRVSIAPRAPSRFQSVAVGI